MNDHQGHLCFDADVFRSFTSHHPRSRSCWWFVCPLVKRRISKRKQMFYERWRIFLLLPGPIGRCGSPQILICLHYQDDHPADEEERGGDLEPMQFQIPRRFVRQSRTTARQPVARRYQRQQQGTLRFVLDLQIGGTSFCVSELLSDPNPGLGY